MDPRIAAAGWQNAELDREDQNQHQTKHKGRHRKAKNGQRDYATIRKALPMQGRINTCRNAKAQLDDQRGNRNLKRGGYALQHQIDGRCLVSHGDTEVEAQYPLEIRDILKPQRVIQPPGLAKRINGFLRRIWTEHDLRRIARHAQNHESEGHDQKHRDQRAKKTGRYIR